MPRRRRKVSSNASGSAALESLVQQALNLTRTARRHHKSLGSDNFYANKLVQLRADATNIFRDFSARSAGDASAMAEMLETVFSPSSQATMRSGVAKELIYSLRTTWREAAPVSVTEEAGLFPLTILAETKRGYLAAIGRQMNGCYSAAWYDAAAVMMRRLLEASMIEAFEGKAMSHKIKDGRGDYLQLSELIDRAMAESTWSLSRNTRRALPHLRDVGHMSAHGRYYLAKKDDIERIRPGCRVAIEEFLHHGGLL
jgi:hypothetical protein